MKVRCINNKIDNQDIVYTNLTIQKEYIVLSIEFYNKEKSVFSKSIGDYVLYRIEDDDGIVIPFPSKLFVVISNKLSSCWIVAQEENECYSILPREWANKSFWEDFYNDEHYALKSFEDARNQIYAEGK